MVGSTNDPIVNIHIIVVPGKNFKKTETQPHFLSGCGNTNLNLLNFLAFRPSKLLPHFHFFIQIKSAKVLLS